MSNKTKKEEGRGSPQKSRSQLEGAKGNEEGKQRVGNTDDIKNVMREGSQMRKG